MRKILIIALMLTGVAAYGQPFEVSYTAGTSVNLTSQIDLGADLTYTFPVGESITLGLGAGVRYARPIFWHKTSVVDGNKSINRSYVNEVTVPMYGRFRYQTGSKVYFQTDAGYRITLVDFFSQLSGPYIDPQVGFKIDGKRSWSAGLSFQYCPVYEDIEMRRTSDYYVSWGDMTHKLRHVAFVRYTKTL